MLVTLFCIVCTLNVVMPVWLALVVYVGFETPSVLERYVQHKAERRRRRYTLTPSKRVLPSP